MLKARALVGVVVVVAVVVSASGCTKRKKRRAPVDAGVVDVVVDAGVVDAGVLADAGSLDAGVDAGVLDGGVDAGVVDAGDADAGITVVEEGCAAERQQMQALLLRAKAEPAAALASSKSLWGTGVCRMDTAVRFGRADLLRATAEVTADLSTKKDLLAEAAELKPLYATYAQLAEACDAINDGKGALEAWQHAQALAPKSRLWFVSGRIDELQRKLAVEERFESRQGQHFVARYEGDERKDLADLALSILDNARTQLERTLGVVPPVPITVVLYTGDQYARSSSGPDWSGGVFDGKIRIRESQLKANRGTLEDILFHEYLHALLRTTVASSVPAWFNEGLAQWVEPDGDKDDIAARMKQRRRDELPSLATLSRGFGSVSDRKEVRLRYDSAFDLVVELEQWRTARSFAEMFKLMHDGKRFEEAFDEVYGMNLEVFESRWKSRYR